jgi:hypothetical protein
VELSALSLLTYGLRLARKLMAEPKVAAKRKTRRKATVNKRSAVVLPSERRVANEN